MASQRSAQSTALLQNAILVTYEINGNTHTRQESMGTALVKASALGHLDIVKALVDEGADIDTLDHGSTPLTVASNNGKFEIVQYLCDQGAKVDQCDSRGLSALAYAVMHGFTDIVKLLCHYGADVNGQGRCGGTTILHDAVISGDLKMVETLIKANASVDDKYLYKLTPKQLAKTLNHVTIANLLREVKADRSSHRGNKSGLIARIRRKVLEKEDTEEAWEWLENTRDVFQRPPYTLPSDSTHISVGQSNKPLFSSTAFESQSTVDKDYQTGQGLLYSDRDINNMKDQTNDFPKPQCKKCKRSESSRSWVKPPSAVNVAARRLSEHWENQEQVVVQYNIWRSGSIGNPQPDLPFPNASEGCIRSSSRHSLGLREAPSRPASLAGATAETINVSTDSRSTGRNKYIFKKAKFYIDQPELKSMNIDNAGNVAMNNSTINQNGSPHGEQVDSSDDDSSDDLQ